MLALMRGYGAEVVNEGKKILIFIRSQTVLPYSVFSEVRLDGTFDLAKRIYRKIKDEKDQRSKLVLSGYAKVVLSDQTPMVFVYNIGKENLAVTFYIQRYSADNIPLDTALQQLLIQH